VAAPRPGLLASRVGQADRRGINSGVSSHAKPNMMPWVAGRAHLASSGSPA